jgi:putative thioredoxin
VLEKVTKAAKGKLKLVKMNIDEHPPVFQQIAQQMGIQSIPAVLAFVNGQPIDGFLGALPEKQITEFVERLIKDRVGAEEKDALAAADAALAEKDYAGAADLYAKVLAQDANNIAAMAGLARCYVGTGNIEQAKKTLEMVPEAKQNDTAVAAARAAIELAAQTKDLSPVADLEAKVAADPKDYQARFDLALALNANGNREGAIDQLIEIVKRDRKWNDDGARKQLVQLFDAWGPTDEATLNGRKRLSSVLFA